MEVIINGKRESCTEGETLNGLLLRLNLSPEKIVVELNGNIVPAGMFAGTALHEGDTLELLQFVGGG